MEGNIRSTEDYSIPYLRMNPYSVELLSMTFKKIFLLAFILWAFLVLLKVWFFNHTIFENPGTQQIVFWIIVAIVTAALIRRLGVMHYIECFFVSGVWVFTTLLADLFITSQVTSYNIFSKVSYWVSFFVIAFSAFLFHKKRHVQIRKEQAAHHGHGGH
jgi:hypothetical protein